MNLPDGYTLAPAPGYAMAPDGSWVAIAELEWPSPNGNEPSAGDAGPDRQSARRELLEVLTVGEVERRVRSAGHPSWLIESLWPADAYGVLGAEHKAGKTWVLLDLAVSVVTGTAWLGRFACSSPGPVLLYLGEGGERSILRRLEAIVASRGAELADLDGLRIAFGVPRLLNPKYLEEVREELKDRPPRLVGIDPLYLAAGGAKGSDLYAMGEALGSIQRAAQAAGAALCLTTHWNKTGEGAGAKRFTGVGPGAWGRVLGSAAIEGPRIVEADGTTDVRLRWEFTGSEIADAKFRMRRRVRATDPSDLASALEYDVEVAVEEEATEPGHGGRPPSQRRLLAILEDPPGLSVKALGDRLAKDGKGPALRRTTIQEALEALATEGLADADRPGNGRPNKWWRP